MTPIQIEKYYSHFFNPEKKLKYISLHSLLASHCNSFYKQNSICNKGQINSYILLFIHSIALEKS